MLVHEARLLRSIARATHGRFPPTAFPRLVELLQRRAARDGAAAGYECMYDDLRSCGEHPGDSVGGVRVDAVTIAPDVQARVLGYLQAHRADWIEALRRDGKRLGDVRVVRDCIEAVVERDPDTAPGVPEHRRAPRHGARDHRDRV